MPKIIQQMKDVPYVDRKGREYRYGHFFPNEISPFAYNETVAQEYFPLSKEEAEEQGFDWHAELDRRRVASKAIFDQRGDLQRNHRVRPQGRVPRKLL